MQYVGTAPSVKLLLTDITKATDYGNGQNHIDIWTGSSTVNGGQDQINCEDNLTFGGQYSIVRDPPTDYGVNSKFKSPLPASTVAHLL